MTYPRQGDIEIPLLRVLDSLGGEAKPRDVYPLVAKYFTELTEEEQIRRMENAPSSKKWWNMVQWARQSLVEKKEIDGSTPGIWKLTKAGYARIRIESISTIELQARSTRRRNLVHASPTKIPSPSITTIAPELTLRDLVNENRDQIKRRLLLELQSLSSAGFEKFCTVLLGQLGYDDLEVTRRGADGGIDGHGNFRQGVVRIKSAFQAKRWKDATVGRPEVDRFRGAIQGGFDHGVFLTTSRFSSDAQDASVKKGAITVLLLDGSGIADLMIEYGIGIVKQPIYLSEVDDAFFNFEE